MSMSPTLCSLAGSAGRLQAFSSTGLGRRCSEGSQSCRETTALFTQCLACLALGLMRCML